MINRFSKSQWHDISYSRYKVLIRLPHILCGDGSYEMVGINELGWLVMITPCYVALDRPISWNSGVHPRCQCKQAGFTLMLFQPMKKFLVQCCEICKHQKPTIAYHEVFNESIRQQI